jgi:hypothetical protein
MSFDLGNIVSSVLNVAEPLVMNAVTAAFPEAEILTAATNMLTGQYGDALKGLLGNIGNELNMPQNLIKQAQNLVTQATSQLLQAVDPDCASQVANKAGSAGKNLIDQFMNEYKDAWENYKNEQNSKGEGKGSCGGKGGAGGVLGFQEIMALLTQAQTDSFKKLGEDAKNVISALQSDSSSKDGQTQQFEAMNTLKTDGELFQMLSDSISKLNQSVSQGMDANAKA